MTDETRPFAELIETENEGRSHWVVKVEGKIYATDSAEAKYEILASTLRDQYRGMAESLNAAHESRCQARERRAAVKALRAMHQEIVECGREWQSMGHVPTHVEYLRQIEARAAAIERGEVSP
jgi:hypothetical protein